MDARLTAAKIILQKLHTFWRHSDCSTKFKLEVVQAILATYILYSLESAHLPKETLEQLDVFHRKALRTILHMDTTYIDRTNTNQEIYRRANEAIKNETLESFDHSNRKKKLKLDT